MKQGSKIYSIIYNLCPRCHLSNFWKYNNPYKNIIISDHHNLGICETCNLKFEIEPGFFFGSMYVSYAISVFISLLIWIFYEYFFIEYDLFYLICFVALLLFFLSPITYFISRLIWINIFIHYDSKCQE